MALVENFVILSSQGKSSSSHQKSNLKLIMVPQQTVVCQQGRPSVSGWARLWWCRGGHWEAAVDGRVVCIGGDEGEERRDRQISYIHRQINHACNVYIHSMRLCKYVMFGIKKTLCDLGWCSIKWVSRVIQNSCIWSVRFLGCEGCKRL